MATDRLLIYPAFVGRPFGRRLRAASTREARDSSEARAASSSTRLKWAPAAVNPDARRDPPSRARAEPRPIALIDCSLATGREPLSSTALLATPACRPAASSRLSQKPSWYAMSDVASARKARAA